MNRRSKPLNEGGDSLGAFKSGTGWATIEDFVNFIRFAQGLHVTFSPLCTVCRANLVFHFVFQLRLRDIAKMPPFQRVRVYF